MAKETNICCCDESVGLGSTSVGVVETAATWVSTWSVGVYTSSIVACTSSTTETSLWISSEKETLENFGVLALKSHLKFVWAHQRQTRWISVMTITIKSVHKIEDIWVKYWETCDDTYTHVGTMNTQYKCENTDMTCQDI